MAQNLLNFPKHGLILEYEKDLPDNIAVLKLPGSPSRCHIMAIPDPRTEAFKELMSGAAASFDLGVARKQVAELQAARTEAVDDLGAAKLANADLGERLRNSDAALVASTTRIAELEGATPDPDADVPATDDTPAGHAPATEPTAEGASGGAATP
jgi:hypothetical protein